VGRSRLLHPEWNYVETAHTADFTTEDWNVLNGQRALYYAERRAEAVLDLLRAGKDDPTFGYRLNSYHHALQSATLIVRDNLSAEDVVVAVLHDVGYHPCPERHGAFAAELLGGYISERNDWMLRHHQLVDSPEWSRWSSHPHASWTETFFERYDTDAMDPEYDNLPIEFFEPLIRQIFASPARPAEFD
jgi:predicted HD phosphohydrolase